MKPTLEQIKTDESVWPEGATHYINDVYGFYYGELDDLTLPSHTLERHTTVKRPAKAFVPEVGEWCEYKILGKWYKGFYVGKSIDGRVVMEDDVFPPTKCDDPEDFRPIKSERELVVAEAFNILIRNVTAQPREWLGMLYEEGMLKLKEPTK